MPDALDRLATISDDGGSLEKLSLDELRERRQALQTSEQALSYVRRLVQGRLDIVLNEREHRSTGTGSRDAAAVVADLPRILSEHVAGGGRGPLSSVTAPPADVEEVVAEAVAGVDHVIDAARLGSLGELPDGEIDSIIERLAATETRVSQQRRALHAAIDQVQAEIVRRYKTGQASVDALLP